jgi:hypothetical protein
MHDSIVLRPSRSEGWITLTTFLVFAACTAGAFLAGMAWEYRVIFLALCGLGIAAFGELSIRRVTLERGGLSFVRNFRRCTLPRERIESVTWAKGAGVSLRLTDGRWVALPNVGSSPQGVTNTIRAWLRRTAPQTPLS